MENSKPGSNDSATEEKDNVERTDTVSIVSLQGQLKLLINDRLFVDSIVRLVNGNILTLENYKQEVQISWNMYGMKTTHNDEIRQKILGVLQTYLDSTDTKVRNSELKLPHRWSILSAEAQHEILERTTPLLAINTNVTDEGIESRIRHNALSIVKNKEENESKNKDELDVNKSVKSMDELLKENEFVAATTLSDIGIFRTRYGGLGISEAICGCGRRESVLLWKLSDDKTITNNHPVFSNTIYTLSAHKRFAHVSRSNLNLKSKCLCQLWVSIEALDAPNYLKLIEVGCHGLFVGKYKPQLPKFEPCIFWNIEKNS